MCHRGTARAAGGCGRQFNSASFGAIIPLNLDFPQPEERTDCRMERFLKDATAAASDTELWEIFARHLEARGFQSFGYIQFAMGNLVPVQIMGKFRNFPEEWMERYRGGLWEGDPVRSLVAIHPAPFRWREVEAIRSLSPEEIAYKAAVESYDFTDALFVPVFGPGSRNGYLAISLFSAENDLDASLLSELRVICQFMHQRYCELVPPEVTQTVTLSKREREVLRWVSRGKSNSVIAEILGVSINTVDTHLRRIYSKLNVSDRVSAALAGLSKGFIALD